MIFTILNREPLHGHGISQRLAQLTADGFQVNPGSLFPALYKMEQDGKLAAAAIHRKLSHVQNTEAA